MAVSRSAKMKVFFVAGRVAIEKFLNRVSSLAELFIGGT